jgi:hypothetical protein
MTINPSPDTPRKNSGSGKKAADRLPTIAPEEIDRVNLRQALRDFEIANARVVDLTTRLSRLHEQMLDLQHRSSLTHLQLSAAEQLVEQVVFERDTAREEAQLLRASRSYRAGNLLVRVARKLSR